MNKGYTEIDSKFYQEVSLVMLPTEKASILSLDKDENKLYYAPSFGFELFDKKNNFQHNPQHLYFLSDEEIKEGWEGWVYKKDVKGKVFKHFYTTNPWYADAKKIIATTDSELWNVYHENPNANPLHKDIGKPIIPRPSNSFIEKFVTEWNKGNKIDKVLVELVEKKLSKMVGFLLL